MLYYNDLEDKIFTYHDTNEVDELIIISGYLGPYPVEKLESLPFNTTVVYGMYPAHGIGERLHITLTDMQSRISNVDIIYSGLQVHSKCYIWKNNGEIVHVLIGSANFSSNGLRSPYREVLTVADTSTYPELNVYMQTVLKSCTPCLGVVITAGVPRQPAQVHTRTTDYCRMTLLDPSTGETPNTSGLNWGQNPKNHTTKNDAYIAVRAKHIREYSDIFLPKSDFSSITLGGRTQRHNDAIEIVWDDGTIMNGLFEGNYDIGNINYPKQISSFPEKSILGEYIRNRIGVASEERVTAQDLINYGRTHIDISLLEEGIYYLDFSVPIANGG